jgi:ABC-type methionine transport system ATPase subunit
MFVKQAAEQSAVMTQGKIEENEVRVALASESMEKMLKRVEKETMEVERAVEELKEVQASMDQNAVGRLSGLRSGGLVKQGALVGALLFSVRSVVEIIAYSGGDASHLLPAIVQGAIAVACLVVLVFL